MSTFLTYDWAAIEAALDAGDDTPRKEATALDHLFRERLRRKDREKRDAEKAAVLKAKRDADPNTPVYYMGHNAQFFSPKVEWMLKSKDRRKYMEVQVKFWDRKEPVSWLFSYDNISLDWRQQKESVERILNGFAGLVNHPNERPW